VDLFNLLGRAFLWSFPDRLGDLESVIETDGPDKGIYKSDAPCYTNRSFSEEV
jgi:hypothetical protein